MELSPMATLMHGSPSSINITLQEYLIKLNNIGISTEKEIRDLLSSLNIDYKVIFMSKAHGDVYIIVSGDIKTIISRLNGLKFNHCVLNVELLTNITL